MDMKHEGTEEGGRFAPEGEPGAELLYGLPRPHAMVIEHTLVPPALGGRGIGTALVTAAVDYARTMGLRVEPRCSFAARLFAERPDWQGLLED